MRHRLAALPVATALVLAGCGQAPTSSRAVVHVGNQQVTTPGALSAADIADAQRALGVDLLARACAKDPMANQVQSPTSAALALGMLDAGARGGTQTAVSHLLHLDGWGATQIAALRAQRDALAEVKQVQSSNHVYAQSGLKPEQKTLDDIATAFAGDLRTVDFAGHPAAATDAINADVAKDTRGLIKKLYDAPLPELTEAVLTNAVHLDATWKTRFKPAVPGDFRTASGRTVTAQLMNGSDLRAARRTSKGWTSVALPYQGGQLQAFAVLPPASGRCAPTSQLLSSLTTGAAQDNVGLRLPRLHLAVKTDLTSSLAGLGLPLGGDYSGFGDKGLAVSQVLQKAVLDVDEAGTKAAAATGISMEVSARVGGEVVSFDRPFLLLLQDTATASPLFLARIADPS